MKHLCLRGLVIAATSFFGVCGPTPASAQNALLAPWQISSPYLGGGVSYVHHTGLLFISPYEFNAEKWVLGAKVFTGFRLSPVFSAEIAYHLLGKSDIRRTALNEESHALAVVLLAHHRFSNHAMWTETVFGPDVSAMLNHASIFAKGGAAYKWISQDMPLGSVISENGSTFLIGFGFELGLPHGYFVRGEYEYIGKIGSDIVINVQHTPLSLSVGRNF